MDNPGVVKEYEEYMTKGTNIDFNNQVIYRFSNGYGASVIKGKGSYGLEVLQLYFPENDSDEYILGNDQYTNLTTEALRDILTKIKTLT